MNYPQQAIDNILNLPADKRCLHALKNIAEAETLYVLADDEGECRFWADEGEAAFLSVLPKQEFAEMVKSEANRCENLSWKNFCRTAFRGWRKRDTASAFSPWPPVLTAS